ncbi:MAG TPA: NADH-quinone oxidoreductase subunit NuoB [bacterium]|nr:NADH-quinone oxidoreductase subunit NuoB [bacterium]HOL47544.1 NADH-quinone oxidoreductase subunit NuoB [bacterium]HPQ19104.1 NADH-quinone oxidoreductase subunit NuoB [bacterium]
MSLLKWCFKKSLWVFHFAASPCNNCDIEILDLLTPRWDIERFGMKLVGSPRHADVLLLTGSINKKIAPKVKEVYEQTAKPCIVAALGSCGCSMGIFDTEVNYNRAGPADNVIPIDIYIPGCPPKPEAMIMALVKAINKL